MVSVGDVVFMSGDLIGLCLYITKNVENNLKKCFDQLSGVCSTRKVVEMHNIDSNFLCHSKSAKKNIWQKKDLGRQSLLLIFSAKALLFECLLE